MATTAVPSPTPGILRMFVETTIYFLSVTLCNICSTRERCFLFLAIAPVSLVAVLYQWKQHDERYSVYAYSLLCLVSLALLATTAFSFRLAHLWLVHRQEANLSALQAIQEGVQKSTIYLEEHYDLYLPPDFSSSMKHTTKDRRRVAPAGLIFFGGGLVDYRAYGGMASKLAEAGVLVVVPNTEPTRVTAPIFGFTVQFLRNLMAEVQAKYNIEVQEWSLGGHSMGGYLCANLARNMDMIHKALLFGVYVPLGLQNASIDVLAVTATNDGFSFRDHESEEAFFDQLPPRRRQGGSSTRSRTVHVEIQGGNHGGFGDYPKQVFPREDGERTISLEEQHRQIVNATADFLLGAR